MQNRIDRERLWHGHQAVSNQSTFATRIDPLAGRVIPHVAMSQKFVSQRRVSSSVLE